MGDFALLIQMLAAKVRPRGLLDGLHAELMRIADFRQYLFDLPEMQLVGVLRAAELKVLQAGETLFSKGEASDQLYVVLRGTLGVYDGHSPSDPQLAVGRVFGDRGLTRRAPRQYTCRAMTDCALLTLGVADFKACLEQAFHVRNEEKLMYIDRFLPGARSLPLHTKARIAAALVLCDFPKGRNLASPGRMSQFLYLLRTGECTVRGGHFSLVCLGSGSWLGEEALLGKASEYLAEVSAESTSAYVVATEDITRILPEAVLEHMRRQCALKQRSRVSIASKMHNSNSAELLVKTPNVVFRLAHPAAKRRLIIAHQRKPSLGQSLEWTRLRQDLHHYTPCWPDGALTSRT